MSNLDATPTSNTHRSRFVRVASAATVDITEFALRLSVHGPLGGIQFLNRRTPHRFTGIFQFAGEFLKSVELVDKWNSTVRRADDIPIASAYCAHLHRTGEPLVVKDGRHDPRVPWMNHSPVRSYCGAVIESPAGVPWGALCHFDVSPCESTPADIPLMVSAARLLWPVLTAESI